MKLAYGSATNSAAALKADRVLDLLERGVINDWEAGVSEAADAVEVQVVGPDTFPDAPVVRARRFGDGSYLMVHPRYNSRLIATDWCGCSQVLVVADAVALCALLLYQYPDISPREVHRDRILHAWRLSGVPFPKLSLSREEYVVLLRSTSEEVRLVAMALLGRYGVVVEE